MKQNLVVLAFQLLLISHAVAEAPPPGNPFGNGNQAPPPGFQEEEDFLDPGNNLGFQPPANANPTPPQAGNAVPPPPAAITPPTVNTGNRPSNPFPTQPAKTAKVEKPKGAIKLADYLELDSSVKSLEVKNFDLPDKEIKDVVTIISKWTGKNFILDNKVRGKITIIGPSQVTLQEAYQAFLSALEANGLTTVQAGKFIRIIESAEARRSPVKTYAGEYAPKDDQFITRIIQLRYINADEVQREFRDLTTRQGKLFAYEPTNSIIITDTGSNIQRIKELLETLDVKNFETTLHVLHIKNTSAKTISEMLGEIYGDDKSKPGQPRTFRKSSLERTRGGGVITKIIPDEATNSLVVLANQSGIEMLKQLVGKLDVKVTDTGRIHVYYCEYAKAEDLAQTLASLAGGGSGGGSKSKRTPGATGGPGAAPSISGSTGPVSAELEGGVKITSDAATNALVVTANSSDYQTLKKVIKKLDIPRLQVFIETAILEVALDTDTNVGMNLAVGVPGRGFAGGFIGNKDSLISAVTNGLPGEGATIPIFAGPTFGAEGLINGVSTKFSVSTLMGLVNLLTKTTNTSVLQTPQIIAMDNEKAEFQVLDETPVVASSSVTNGQATQNTERLKTGVVVKLTPHVNAASKQIRLEIEQKIDNVRDSAAVPKNLQDTNKATTSRVTNTTVVVKDQDYLMMGGMISDHVDETVTKVPLLGDIPILGWLFKAKHWKIAKTNLVILLHPKIIGSTLVAAETLKEGLNKRQDFIENNFGGDDEHAKQVKELQGKIDSQIERGQAEPAFDYRNNHDDELAEPKNPADQNELNKKGEAPKAKSDTSPTAPNLAPMEGSMGMPPGMDMPTTPDAPLLSTPPVEAGGN